MLKIVYCILLILVTAAFIRTAQLGYTAKQDLFTRGIGTMLPDGLYKGVVEGYTVSWQGKKFDAAHSTGINVFKGADGKTYEKYPFVTSIGTASHDYLTNVLRIDYNISGNPLWLRPVLDELSEVSPGHYIGKLQVRIVPYFPFTLTYFELNK